MTPKEILLEAATLIETSGHCTKYCAVDKNGKYVRLNSPYAVSFCVLGAMHRVCPVGKLNDAFDAISAFAAFLEDSQEKTGNWKIVASWNDKTDAATVVETMRKAAETFEDAVEENV